MEIQEGGRTGGTRRDSALVSDIVEHATMINESQINVWQRAKRETQGMGKNDLYVVHAFSARMSDRMETGCQPRGLSKLRQRM